jgi:hypothetical protein
MTVPPEVAAYLASLREALEDLPGTERDDLLAEVEDSLLDAAADGSIEARLGQPGEFAAELRAAAGLHPRPSESQRPRLQAWRSLAERLVADPRARSGERLARELAPAWWIARGYVAVAAVALLLGSTWSVDHPAVPRLLGSAEAGVLLILLTSAASVWLGLRTRHADGRLTHVVVALNVLLVLSLAPLAHHLREPRPTQFVYVTESTPPAPGLANAGSPVLNIYPYSRDGRLLHDVLLYDAFGNPLEIGHNGVADPNRRFLRTPVGAVLFNSFPIRYYEPGTTRVARPNAGPVVRVPRIATPALVTQQKQQRRR